MKRLILAFVLAIGAATTCSALLWIQPSRFVAAPSGPTMVASDSFSYGNGTDLNTTGSWGSVTGQIAAFVGEAQGNTSSAWALYYSSSTYNSNQYSTATIVGSSPGATGPSVRQQSGSGALYHVRYNSFTGSVELARFAGGTDTVITSSAISWSSGTKLWLEASGTGSATRLTAKIDTGSGWAILWSNVDPGGTYIDGGKPGIAIYGGWGAITIDNWSGGNL